MTSKKKLKKINRKLMAEHLAISGENEKLMADFTEIAYAWSTYQSTHPDLTGVVNCLITIAEQGEERNSLIRRNIESGERAEKKMEAWEESLKDDTAPPDLTDIQREAVERDYPDTEAQFEENLAQMLHRAEDEGDNHCVIMGAESNGNVKAWIRVLFTGPPEGVDYMASVFNYRGKNYLEYDKWNETKLRDIRLQQAQQTATDFEETVKKRNAYIDKQAEVIADLKRTQELHESQIKAFEAEKHKMADTAVAERVSTEHNLNGGPSNMRDPRYRAAVEAMDDVRGGNYPDKDGQLTSAAEMDRAYQEKQAKQQNCSHAIIYREKNEDKCTECGAVVWPKPERAFKTPF